MTLILAAVVIGTIFVIGVLIGASVQNNRADRRRRHARNVHFSSAPRAGSPPRSTAALPVP